MNPNTKVHAALKINGRVIHLGEGTMEIKQVPIALARTIMDSDLTPQTFSGLELKVSKRPIQWDKVEDGFDTGIMQHVKQVANDDPVEGFPDITYGELAALEDDPIWIQYRNLRVNPEQFQGQDGTAIAAQWWNKYGQSKFRHLLTA